MTERECRNGHVMGRETYCSECGEPCAYYDGLSIAMYNKREAFYDSIDYDDPDTSNDDELRDDDDEGLQGDV